MSPQRVEDYEPGVLRVLQSKDETRSFYNKIAHVYDLLAEHSEQPMRKGGLTMLSAAPGERVLEIGYGTGHCMAELAEAVGPSGKVYGIDIADEMRRLAGDLVAKKEVADRVELVWGKPNSCPTTRSPWTPFSQASRWNFSTRRRFHSYWPNAGGCLSRVVASWLSRFPRRANQGLYSKHSNGRTAIFRTSWIAVRSSSVGP